MNPWLAQDLSASRRQDMYRAATQRRLAREAGQGSIRLAAGRWLIAAGNRLAGDEGPGAPRQAAIGPVVRLGG